MLTFQGDIKIHYKNTKDKENFEKSLKKVPDLVKQVREKEDLSVEFNHEVETTATAKIGITILTFIKGALETKNHFVKRTLENALNYTNTKTETYKG